MTGHEIATGADHRDPEPQMMGVGPVAPSSPDIDQMTPEDQHRRVGSGDPISPPAETGPEPRFGSLAGNPSPPPTRPLWAPGTARSAEGRSDQQPAIEEAESTLGPLAAGGSNGTRPPAMTEAATMCSPPGSGAFDELRLYAECFEDAQRQRIAMGNRLGSGSVDPDFVKKVLGTQKTIEDLIAVEMKRCLRLAAPELVVWAKSKPGIGEHLLARLLGAIGDPLIAVPHAWMETPPDDHECPTRGLTADGKPRKVCGEGRHLVAGEPFIRNVAKLWAYCGHGDPERQRRRGMSADDATELGNPQAKKITHLLAESCIKQTCEPCREQSRKRKAENAGKTPPWAPPPEGCICAERGSYRADYDARRIVTAEGRDWTPGRKGNDALRIVGKHILRDLWIAARQAKVASESTTRTPGGPHEDGAA